MRKPRRKFGATQKDRLFLAVLPDAATAARIHALAETLKAAHGFTGTLILPEHLHVTLFHLGDWASLPEPIVAAAHAAADELSAAPFEVTFDRVQSFRNSTGVYPYVLVGPERGSALHGFHATLGAALKKHGLGSAVHGDDFVPHVTLLRDGQRAAPRPIAPIEWTVRDLALVHSLLGKTTHIHLARWPLGGDKTP